MLPQRPRIESPRPVLSSCGKPHPYAPTTQLAISNSGQHLPFRSTSPVKFHLNQVPQSPSTTAIQVPQSPKPGFMQIPQSPRPGTTQVPQLPKPAVNQDAWRATQNDKRQQHSFEQAQPSQIPSLKAHNTPTFTAARHTLVHHTISAPTQGNTEHQSIESTHQRKDSSSAAEPPKESSVGSVMAPASIPSAPSVIPVGKPSPPKYPNEEKQESYLDHDQTQHYKISYGKGEDGGFRVENRRTHSGEIRGEDDAMIRQQRQIQPELEEMPPRGTLETVTILSTLTMNLYFEFFRSHFQEKSS